MASQDEDVEKGFLEEWELDSQDYSNKTLKKILKRLPGLDAKKLVLIHFNHPQKSLWQMQPVPVQQAIEAIKDNEFIVTLELTNAFVKPFSSGLSRQKKVIDLRVLTRMKGLKHLILHNEGWSPLFFDSLVAYLSHDACSIETLELKSELTEDEFTQLQTAFQTAASLQQFRGASHEAALQAVLSEKVLLLKVF